MPKIPEPNYEYDIEKLRKAYEKAITDIRRELESVDLTDLGRANAVAAMADASQILKELDKTSGAWVAANIPAAATEGVAATLLSLGVASTIAEARNLAKFNGLNRHMVDAVIADTQQDLLAVTKNVERRVRNTIRQVSAEVMRENMARGINGRRTIKSDILAGVRKKLGESVETGIVDAAGRRWKPEVYADMLVRTKMLYAHIEGTTNEAIARGVMYATISRHGATDACSKWEGRIVKLTAEAPGPYPTVAEAKASREIFHPNCKHVISPLRDPSRIDSNGPKARQESAAAPEPKVIKGRSIELNRDTDIVKNVKADYGYLFDDGKGAGGDPILTELLKAQKFNGLPHVVSESDIDRFVQSGEREIYRGLTDGKFTQQFKTGELYSGYGVYGNGTYAAHGPNARQESAAYANSSGEVMRMTLRKDAKVVHYNDLRAEAAKEYDRLSDLISREKDDDKISELSALQAVAADVGRFAVYKGIDAIDIVSPEYMVILNRTALRVQDTNYSGRDFSLIGN